MKLFSYLILIFSTVSTFAGGPNFRPLIPRLAERGYFNGCENGRKNILSMLEGTFSREDINDFSDVKSEKELDDWMKCYASPTAVKAYEDSKPALKEIEKDFGPPFALMACKIWQETRWVNGQTSRDNAQGLVQIVPQQVSMLRGIMNLATTDDPPQLVKDYKKLNEEHIKAMKAVAELKVSPEAEGQSLDFYTKREKELQDKIFDLRKNNEVVRNYDYAIVMQSAWQDWATKNGYPPTICPTGNCNQAPYQKLNWSLAAGALNSLYLMLKLDDDYALKNSSSDETMTYSREEFKLIVAAAYNSGQSGPVQDIKPQAESEDEFARIKKFLANIKARSAPGTRGWNQTACYVSNMDSCLRPGNFVPSNYELPTGKEEICKKTAGENLQQCKNSLPVN